MLFAQETSGQSALVRQRVSGSAIRQWNRIGWEDTELQQLPNPASSTLEPELGSEETAFLAGPLQGPGTMATQFHFLACHEKTNAVDKSLESLEWEQEPSRVVESELCLGCF